MQTNKIPRLVRGEVVYTKLHGNWFVFSFQEQLQLENWKTAIVIVYAELLLTRPSVWIHKIKGSTQQNTEVFVFETLDSYFPVSFKFLLSSV